MFKLILTAIIAVSFSMQAQTKINDTLKLKISLKVEDATVEEALQMIQKKSRDIDPYKKGVNIIIQEKDAKKITTLIENGQLK